MARIVAPMKFSGSFFISPLFIALRITLRALSNSAFGLALDHRRIKGIVFQDVDLFAVDVRHGADRLFGVAEKFGERYLVVVELRKKFVVKIFPARLKKELRLALEIPVHQPARNSEPVLNVAHENPVVPLFEEQQESRLQNFVARGLGHAGFLKE